MAEEHRSPRSLPQVLFIASALSVGVGAGVAAFLWSREGPPSQEQMRAQAASAAQIERGIAEDERFVGVTVSVIDAGDGGIRISGYVARNEDLDALRSIVDQAAPPGAVMWDVRVVGVIPQ